MRNIKLLWGLVGCLGATVLVLGLLLVKDGAAGSDEGVPGDPAAGDRVVAKVGSKEFKLSILEQQLLQKYGMELLNQLLDREVLRLEAEEQKIKISREELDAELTRMSQGYDSEEHFYDSMKNQLGMSKEDIREDVYYKLILEKIATAAVTVSNQEISQYIKEHPEEFAVSSQLRIQKIVSQTEEQAKRTLELARSGKDFGLLAKERSLDTSTSSDGGDLGWLEDNDPFIPQELLKAARMMKVGDISSPIKTAEGYTVIKLKDKKDVSKGTPEEINTNVHRILALQKAPPLADITQTLRVKYKAEIEDSELAL